MLGDAPVSAERSNGSELFQGGVSVVIPNWNGADLLAANLPAAVEASRKFPGPCEVIVVDDGSSDDSRTAIAAHPSVLLEAHDTNRGFSEACLSGVKRARHARVLLLNSDARPEPDALRPLCAAFAEPEVFAATPLVLDEDGGTTDVTISIPTLRRGRIRYRSVSTEPLAGSRAARPWFTFFPLGGAVMVDRERFLALGGFDPLYHPFYYEDVDLGFAAWRRGWSCVVVPASRVVHAGGGTIGRAFRKRSVRVTKKRNRVLFHCKNLTGTAPLARFAVQQLLRCLVRLLRFDTIELSGTLAALPRVPAALARRRTERAAAERSDAEILALIEGRWRANVEDSGREAVAGS